MSEQLDGLKKMKECKGYTVGRWIFCTQVVTATPTNFPLLGIEFAIPLLWLIVFLLSWGGTFIMLKVPGLKDLL